MAVSLLLRKMTQIDIWTHLGRKKETKEQTYSTQTMCNQANISSSTICHKSQLITSSEVCALLPGEVECLFRSPSVPFCLLTAVSACSPEVLAVAHMSTSNG